MDLQAYSFPQLVRLLKFLRGGSIGFDAHRDERTRTKDRIIDFIRTQYDDEAIAAGIKAATLLTNAEYAAAKGSGAKIKAQTVEDFQAAAPEAASPTAPGKPTDVSTAAQLLADALAAMRPEVPPLDESAVLRLVEGHTVQAIAKAVEAMPAKVLRIEAPDRAPVEVQGRQHFRFESLVKLCSARKRDGTRFNIWLHGPAGAGKTTAGMRAAQACGLSFWLQSAVVEPFQLLGYKDAQSNVIRTPFREAWEHGGIVLLSEADSNSEAAMLAINPALANGVCTFPDAQLPRHKDCVVIADANTNGSGGTHSYNGRTKQDSALLSRFAFLDWPVDEACERDAAGHAQWCKIVQHARKVAKDNGSDITITPRATYDGADLLSQGWAPKDVVELVLRQGASAEAWAPIASSVDRMVSMIEGA